MRYKKFIRNMILAVMISAISLLSGCSRSIEYSEDEINTLWQLYYSKEFTDSLDKVLSAEQRKDIMKRIAAENRLDYSQMMYHMQQNDPDRFKKLFN